MKKTEARNLYVYGETPLTTWDKIAKECGISSSDIVYDLGCGRGRGVCWLASQVGCRAVGIEIIEEFVRKAKAIAKFTSCRKAFFRQEEIAKTDLTEATILYHYDFFVEGNAKEALVGKFSQLKNGTRIVSVGEKLPFECLKEFEGRFPWGKATIYLQIVLTTCSSERLILSQAPSTLLKL